MSKFPYRQLGIKLDRNYRNDLNANFVDIEADIKELGAAPAEALAAADEANTQALYAQEQGDFANTEGTFASEQGTFAQTQGTFAQEQGDYALEKGDYAKQVGDDNKTNFLTAVATVTERDTNYPTPAHGDTVRVTSEAKSYRYVQGSGWVVTDVYNPTAIDEVNAQLAENTTVLSPIASANSYKDAIIVKHGRKGYWFYQAIIKNPLKDTAYTNEIVGIHASFDYDECPSVDHIQVLDENNSPVPFEWESAKDPKQGFDYGNHKNGSLRNGTIWVETSLTANQEKVFTIKVYENAITNNFPASVIHTVESASVESLAANGITAKFDDTNAWSLRRILINGFDINSGTNANRVALSDNNKADLNPALANTTILDKKVNGNGIMYREWEVNFKFNYNTDITINYKVRIWKNGKIDFRHYAYATADIAEGLVNGVINKSAWNQMSGTTNTKSGPDGIIFNDSSDGKSVLAGVRHMQFLSEFTGSDTGFDSYYNNGIGSTNLLYVGWKNPSTKVKSITNGSYFSASGYLSFNVPAADRLVEMNRRMNPIITRMAKDTLENLKKKFIQYAKYYIEPMKYWTEKNDNWYFGGLQALQSLSFHEIYGYEGIWLDQSYSKLQSNLTAKYGGGTKQGFINGWNSNYGWEFMGRDMTVLSHLYHRFLTLNDQTKANEMKAIIHNLADAAVDMEVASGGSGMMNLRGTALPDNYNAEGSALVALSESLSIEENTTRRGTFNRIAARFVTAKEFVNKTPYSKSGGTDLNYSMKHPTNHYHCFNLYEAFRANDIQSLGIELPSPRQYIFEFTTATGQVKEADSNYQANRRGFALTHIYAACILARWGGNASDLEHACSLLEHVYSRLMPNGDIEEPLDGWGIPLFANDPRHNAPIETQALIETVKAI
jgi:hypothetical protein